MEKYKHIQPVIITVLTSVLDFESIDLLRIKNPMLTHSSVNEAPHYRISYTELVNAVNNSKLILKGVVMVAKNDIPDNHDFFKLTFSLQQPTLDPENNTSLRCFDIKGNSVSYPCLFKRVEAENNEHVFELMSVDHMSRDSKSNRLPLKPWEFSSDSVSFLHIKNLPANNFYTFYFYFEKV